MALFGVSIKKRTAFRGATQFFYNTYTYEGTSLNFQDALGLINAIKLIEQDLHGSDVTWVEGRAWSTGGTQAQNQMIRTELLSGTGNNTTNASMDRERAVLIRWPAGVDVRGRPVYLRKYFHCCGGCNGNTFTSGHLQNTEALSDTIRTSIATRANALKVITLGALVLTMKGPTGRNATGDAQCHRWLEHHQLGDMWR